MKMKRALEIILVLLAMVYAVYWLRASRWQGPQEERFVSHGM